MVIKKSQSEARKGRKKISYSAKRGVRKGVIAEYLSRGLAEEEVKERQYRFGLNVIEQKKEVQTISILLSQFKSPLIYILVFAAATTIVLGDYIDTLVIGIAVIVNTILGFYQEYRAQRSLAALRGLLSPKANVIREGQRKLIDAGDLVPGDVCLAGIGEKIPADGLVVFVQDFAVNEAILTGESVPVHKKKIRISEINKTDVDTWQWLWNSADREAKVYSGTIVASGEAVLVVSVIGNGTEVGKIASSLGETREELTPLQKRIGRFSKQLAIIVAAIAFIIFLTGILLGIDFVTIFTTSVAVAVAAIPEGLAVSLTVILALGMQRILKRRSLVRKLVAAETLGNVTVICADKTGTLTEGVMRVAQAEFIDEMQGIEAAILTNDRRDPLEIALWDWVWEERRIDPQSYAEQHHRIDSMPFSPEKKFSAKLFEKDVYVIGAPEIVLSFCSFSGPNKQKWLKRIEEYGLQGLRIIGFATRERKTGEKQLKERNLVHGLRWLGIIVFEDPIRKGVAEALDLTRKAGIEVKVITGDYRATAEGVLERLGLLTKKAKLAAHFPLVMEGEEMESLSEDEISRRVTGTVLFARIDPFQKLKIVEALKKSGEIVAMTGDGVNDAPALKRADIGIVVSRATDVAKETADMVLLDDNFATIAAAIEEGRAIFVNLRKVILYLLSDSFSEVILVLGSLLLKIPLPLTAAQILWINLITDGFPNLALTVEPKEDDLMKQKPRNPNEPLIDTEIKLLIFLISATTGIMTLLAFLWFWRMYGGSPAYVQTLAFTMLGIDSLVYVFNARSLRTPIWKSNFFANPWLVLAVFGGLLIQLIALYAPFLQDLLQTRPLSSLEWFTVIIECLLVVGIIEGVKLWFLKKRVDHSDWVEKMIG